MPSRGRCARSWARSPRPCRRPARRRRPGWPRRSPPSSPCWRCPTPGSRSRSPSTTPSRRRPTRSPTGSPLLVGGRWLRHTASGVDEVEFLLAANTGAEPRPLHKGASGGELSRVMLALEVALAGTSPVPTFVFDEVDAGVGRRGRGRGGPPAGPAGPDRPGAGGDPPAPGRGVRRPARPGREGQRRLGDQLGAHRPRRARPASASCPGCWPGWPSPTPPGPCPRAAGGGSPGPGAVLTRSGQGTGPGRRGGVRGNRRVLRCVGI